MSDNDNVIILYRFYNNFDICKERIKTVKHFNPNTSIYGHYGGSKENYKQACKELSNDLERIDIMSSDDPHWKWFHCDLTIKEWYRNVGCKIKYDFVYDMEWDILEIGSINELHPKIDAHSVALSGITEINKVSHRCKWLVKEPYKSDFETFRKYMKKRFGLDDQIYTSLGTAPFYSKDFLKDFSNTEDNQMVLFELALPAYIKALNYKLVDNGLHPGWYSNEADTFFNTYNNSIKYDAIYKECKRLNGRRFFHPVKYMVYQRDAAKLYSLIPKPLVFNPSKNPDI